MMLGGEGDITKEVMNKEDIDCSIEIVDNIIGCFNTEISNNKKLPHFVISTSKGEFFDVDRPIELESYSKLYVLSFEMENIKSIIYFNMNIDSINFINDSGWREKIEEEIKDYLSILDNQERLNELFKGIEESCEEKNNNDEFDKISQNIKNRPNLKNFNIDSVDEYFNNKNKNKKITIIKERKMENDSLLNDIEVNVKILVGSQILTLEELKNLKENSTIELNQLANSPLTIFVNNVPYGQGEVVIVDGMYGVQITKLYTKEDVYHV
jgi:flagellar motor switch protein FliN